MTILLLPRSPLSLDLKKADVRELVFAGIFPVGKVVLAGISPFGRKLEN
jgi:hypothetical protein